MLQISRMFRLLQFISMFLVGCTMFLSQTWFAISKYGKNCLRKSCKIIKIRKSCCYIQVLTVMVTLTKIFGGHKPCYNDQWPLTGQYGKDCFRASCEIIKIKKSCFSIQVLAVIGSDCLTKLFNGHKPCYDSQ